MAVYEYEIDNVLPEYKVVAGVAPSAMTTGGGNMRIIIKEVKVEVVKYGETEVLT